MYRCLTLQLAIHANKSEGVWEIHMYLKEKW